MTDKDAADLALPYTPEEMETARRHLLRLSDVAPAALPAPGDVEPPRRVIRRKDLDDLFDTDPDLTGFDVDVSPYVRDAADTDVHVFWRDLSPPIPHARGRVTMIHRARGQRNSARSRSAPPGIGSRRWANAKRATPRCSFATPNGGAGIIEQVPHRPAGGG